MGFFYFIGSCGAEAWDYTGLNVGLLELIGKGYVIEHCVSLFNRRQKEQIYRNYVTDTLKMINDNLTKIYGGQYMKTRYADMVEPKKQDTRTGDEIARDIIKRAGLKLRENNDSI